MKLVSYVTDPNAPRDAGRGGVLLGNDIFDIEQLIRWAARNGTANPPAGNLEGPPTTLLELLALGPEAIEELEQAVTTAQRADPNDLKLELGLVHDMGAVPLRAPIPNPPTIRDFYTFEQHVKSARARRGAGMIPEWYELAVFYFSNTSEVYGPEEAIPYPQNSQEMDFELEIACVIGREGKNITADEALDYIAGYLIMNDWSARDLWRKEQPLNMGPAKGKDFATSLGPWLVTPDELADFTIGSGAEQRLNLSMTARINGDMLSTDNAKNMYYSFPQIIQQASMHARLRPGDVIGSGTCGTGCILELGTERHRWLQPGDTVELVIERLGMLRNTIAAPEGK
jgi:fumarylacetoacetate (FAA) hydrolase